MVWKVLCITFLMSGFQLGLSAPVYFNKRLEEADQIALESTGLLLPLDPVVRRIMRDLKSIRDRYPEINDVIHKKKWVPGEVILPKGVSEDQIYEIEDSGLFAPLQEVKSYRSGSLLVFSKPYNSERLAERIYEKFGIRAEPNTNDSSTSNGYISYNPTDETYSIEKKPVTHRFAGFRTKYSWEFSVKNGKVKQLRSTKPGFEFTT